MVIKFGFSLGTHKSGTFGATAESDWQAYKARLFPALLNIHRNILNIAHLDFEFPMNGGITNGNHAPLFTDAVCYARRVTEVAKFCADNGITPLLEIDSEWTFGNANFLSYVAELCDNWLIPAGVMGKIVVVAYYPEYYDWVNCNPAAGKWSNWTAYDRPTTLNHMKAFNNLIVSRKPLGFVLNLVGGWGAFYDWVADQTGALYRNEGTWPPVFYYGGGGLKLDETSWATASTRPLFSGAVPWRGCGEWNYMNAAVLDYQKTKDILGYVRRSVPNGMAGWFFVTDVDYLLTGASSGDPNYPGMSSAGFLQALKENADLFEPVVTPTTVKAGLGMASLLAGFALVGAGFHLK